MVLLTSQMVLKKISVCVCVCVYLKVVGREGGGRDLEGKHMEQNVTTGNSQGKGCPEVSYNFLHLFQKYKIISKSSFKKILQRYQICPI